MTPKSKSPRRPSAARGRRAAFDDPDHPSPAPDARAAAFALAATVRRIKSGKPVPIFLVEDNRVLRDGLTAMLGAQGLKVVATARTGTEALRHVARLKPELILLDTALGDRDALRFVATVRALAPNIKVIVMHLLPAHGDVVAFVRAGVNGFIMKDASILEFVTTIRAVADGKSVLPPIMTDTLFANVAEQVLRRGARSVKAAMRMTAREREVITLIAEGLGNRDIAKQLHIAAHTVKSHVHNILEKLALHTRLEVAAYAHAHEGRTTTT